MKLVIQTQYKENYAFPEWDGKGDCPEYWKFKGGNTYVLANFHASPNDEYMTKIIKDLTPLIEHSNEASMEYILDWEIINDVEKVCQDWETPIEVLDFDGSYVATKNINNRGEYGYMRKEIQGLQESWVMLPNKEREDYTARYIMQDGDVVYGQEELKEWFKINELISQEVAQ